MGMILMPRALDGASRLVWVHRAACPGDGSGGGGEGLGRPGPAGHSVVGPWPLWPLDTWCPGCPGWWALVRRGRRQSSCIPSGGSSPSWRPARQGCYIVALRRQRVVIIQAAALWGRGCPAMTTRSRVPLRGSGWHLLAAGPSKPQCLWHWAQRRQRLMALVA